MAAFWVGFDGKWQHRFDDFEDAEDWAREVAETGRLVWVVRRRPLREPSLLTIYPSERAEEGRRLWRDRAKVFGPSNMAPYAGGI